MSNIFTSMQQVRTAMCEIHTYILEASNTEAELVRTKASVKEIKKDNERLYSEQVGMADWVQMGIDAQPRIKALEALCKAVYYDYDPVEIHKETASTVAVWDEGARLLGRGKAEDIQR